MIALRVAAVAAGVFIVAATFASAVRTVILPRGVPARLTRIVFVALRVVFNLRARPSASYERRDRVLALYGPIGLLLLLVVWVSLLLLGYTLIYWGIIGDSFGEAFRISGSSLLTLGFLEPVHLGAVVVAFVEAAMGLVLLAMLITYLPSIYAAFQRREGLVTSLEVRAGSPPTGVRLVRFFFVMEQLDRLSDFWKRWEAWFVDIEESHTSFPTLAFFRSPQPEHSWITAAGAVLDGASLLSAAVDVPREAYAEFAIRAGYLALRRICDFYAIPYPIDPLYPDEPISVSREEFDEAWDHLVAEGVPMKPDREQAWIDFAGWRVNYDTVLLELAAFVSAPVAPWVSDRGIRARRPPIFRVGRGRPVRQPRPS